MNGDRKRGGDSPAAPPAKRADQVTPRGSFAQQNISPSQNSLAQLSNISSEDNPDQQNNSTPESSSAQQSNQTQKEESLPPARPKKILLQCPFEGIGFYQEGQYSCNCLTIDMFGILLNVEIVRKNGHLCLHVHNATRSHQFILDFEYSLQVIGKVTRRMDGRWNENIPFRCIGNCEFMSWEEVEDILVNNAFTVRFEMTIIKTEEVNGVSFLEFNKPTDLSDVALVVQDQKFHVAKNIVAFASNLFNDLFFGEKADPNIEEVTLHGHDPRDVQTVLELMHLKPALSDASVEGALHIANHWRAEDVKLMCQVFLLEKSEKGYGKLMHMFTRYSLDWHKVLNKMQSAADVKSAISLSIENMPKEAIEALLLKIKYFYQTGYYHNSIPSPAQQDILCLQDPADKPNSPSVHNTAAQSNNWIQKENQNHPVIHSKCIKFECTIKGVNNLETGNQIIYRKVGDDFGICWCVQIARLDGNLAIFVCDSNCFREYMMDIEYKITITGSDPVKEKYGHCEGTYQPFERLGSRDFMKWEEVQDILNDGALTVNVEMRIIKTVPVKESPIQNFDKPMGKPTDVVLVVQNQKFHVSKKILATHSKYFKGLFSSGFVEGSQPEVTICGHDPRDVQTILELMHLKLALKDSSVEGALLFADFCESESVTDLCQVFLLEKSKKSLKKKFEMFVNYHLDLDKLLCQMTSLFDVVSVFPDMLSSLPLKVSKALLLKSVTFV